MYYLSNPERVKGAIKFRADDNTVRVDTTQYAIEAFSRILEIIN